MFDLTANVRAAQTGDQAAFQRLVERFQHMAVGYALALLHDYHRAEDVAQEAFLEMHGQLPRLEHPAAFPGLLRKLLVKHADRLVRRKKHRAVALDAAGDIASVAPAPAAAAESRERHRQLHLALENLPQAPRIVLSLFYIRQRPLAEIAAFLNVPVSTVKNRLHVARKTLQQRMLSMVSDEIVKHAPDDGFAQRVAQAVSTFTAKGPTDGHMLSSFSDAMRTWATWRLMRHSPLA